jgi:hypothetical protein
MAAKVSRLGASMSSISQSLSTRSFSAPSASCSWRCSQRWRSQRESQAAPATTTTSHWPRSESGATGVPARSPSASDAGSGCAGTISSL